MTNMAKRYTAITVIYVLSVFSPLLPGFPRDSIGYGTAMTAVFFVTLLAVLLLLLPERQMRSETPLPAGESVLWAIGGTFGLYVLQIIASLITMAILGQPTQSDHTRQIVQITETAPLFLISVSIIGPILEEIVFRKIFYGGLQRKVGFLFAALISSAVFAVAHFDLRFVLVYFAIGFFLCYVYHKTRRIVVPMFMHATMNAVAVMVTMNNPFPTQNPAWVALM